MKQMHHQTHDNPSNFVSLLRKKPAFLVVFVFLVQNIAATETQGSVKYSGNETDRVALLAIKNRLVDHPNGVLSSWNDSIPHCSWEGITCGRTHNRVTVLDLNSKGLAGTISPFIGNLSFLKIIKLYNNSLSGEIPKQVSHILRLEELRINNNTLTGEIPANISRCRSLRYVSLAYNKLRGRLPAGLSALSELQDLRMRHNYLTGPVFDIIQNLTSLVVVSAAMNSFTGTIPSSIGRLQNLTFFAFGANNLSGTIPTSLFNISSLQVLDFLENQMHGELPEHMGFTVPQLYFLHLGDNNFSGSIPITIQNLTALQLLGLESNSFTGTFPHDFRYFYNLSELTIGGNYLTGDINFVNTLVNCSQLTILHFGSNNISGILPKSVANLSTSLEWFITEDTLISGTIPAGITNLASLVDLVMDNCKLTGSIPHDIGKLQFLENIHLFSNRLSGKIPNSLGNLSFLSSLGLQNNILEGSIPPSLGNCKSLLYMSLSYNELSGTLGNELFEGSASFVELDLSYNHLEGSLPLEMSKQNNLDNLILSNNKFSGVIPDGLGDCADLQYLFMAENSFYGNIPPSFASLSSLLKIDLSRNNLSGQIPPFFSRFPTLYYLNLSYNDFEGSVPTNSVFANGSAFFVAGNSRLCGGIKQLHLPKCIQNKSTKRKKRAMPHALKLIIPVVSALVAVLAMGAGLYLACIKKKKTPLLPGSVMGNAIMKVSYDMLLKATAGFSSDNQLGKGSFGSVFKGILDGKTVAVKVLNLEHRGASKSFMSECKTLRNVRHRNLVGIITVCSSIDFQGNDFKALVYEFMPNGSLDRWLHGVHQNMSLAQRVNLAIDVAHALNYLHHECETPIVHCDLKPSNILLDDDMVTHVGDFGLAKFLTQPRHPNQSSTIGIKGTVGYAAPEYGFGSEPSTEGDVYSYGILLLELMTGKGPTDDMFKEGYNLHLHARGALPDQVLQIVDPLLEKDDLTEEVDDTRANKDEVQRRGECIVSVINVGVSCSNHLPHDRMKITDAISRLQSARDNLPNAS
ncbi:uncharacterized protein LOC141606994 [Silene latifolia]|uniref:uncharacterized protein LOC141606994 n=1 Tax=Silene latifolia TaxID=37657 RepID=UPI003D773E7C